MKEHVRCRSFYVQRNKTSKERKHATIVLATSGGTLCARGPYREWERQTIRCPAEQEMPFVLGGVVHFPKDICAQCPLKAQCTTSTKGRSVSIHPDEALIVELRQSQQMPEGRAKLRERVAVEHTFAHIGQWQGRRARYRGVRKNLFDLRRCAVVHNLHVLARSQPLQGELQKAA